jgi:hypothetical protein
VRSPVLPATAHCGRAAVRHTALWRAGSASVWHRGAPWCRRRSTARGRDCTANVSTSLNSALRLAGSSSDEPVIRWMRPIPQRAE